MKSTILKIVFGIIFILITALTLAEYAKLIQHLLSVKYNWLFEMIMVAGMLLFQLIFIFKNDKNLIVSYFSKILLVSFIGSSLLWPLLLINEYHNLSDIINLTYFFSVVSIMFFIHKNIVTQMKLPLYLSYTYILYRFIILLFII